MGEAARRKAWLATLDAKERVLVHTAQALQQVPLDGACYLFAFFLDYYLRDQHGLDGRAVVGFVNDGTDDIYGSHAWYVFRDKMTDVALCRPLQPDLQPPGPLVIHGRQFTQGSDYTYHLTRPAEGAKAVERYLRGEDGEEAREIAISQEALHRQMLAIAVDPSRQREYLDNAPDFDYAALVSLVESTPMGRRIRPGSSKVTAPTPIEYFHVRHGCGHSAYWQNGNFGIKAKDFPCPWCGGQAGARIPADMNAVNSPPPAGRMFRELIDGRPPAFPGEEGRPVVFRHMAGDVCCPPSSGQE